MDAAAEAAVLSAVMLSPVLLDEVRGLVEPHDFFMVQHRSIYEAILAADDSNQRIDVVTIAAQLRAAGRLEQIGGTPFLSQIVDATPSVPNVLEHARIVRQHALLRRLIGTLKDLTITAQQPETRADVLGFLTRAESEVFGVGLGVNERDNAKSMQEVMAHAAVVLDPSRPRVRRGISTGLHELDELSLGMIGGELWYVAGRPGMGKTALALGMAAAGAQTGHGAAFFSMEMDWPELGDRLLSSMSGVQHKAITKRELTAEQWTNAAAAMADLARYPVVIDDTRHLTPAMLRSSVRRQAARLRSRQLRLRVVVVDYVQLMAADVPSRSRNEELEAISRSLKLLAKEFDVTVLACAQLNRADKRAPGARPGLSDLRGSGALEQDADKVLFVHRDGGDGEGDERGDAELILGKGRNSGTGSCRVLWQRWCVRFTDRQQAGFDWRRVDPDDD